jgi:tripartite ATP-independent transporter DctM subunit
MMEPMGGHDAMAASLIGNAEGMSCSKRIAWYKRIDELLGTVTEVPAAVLLFAEIVVLAASVTARYCLRSPLIWSNELSITCFTWISMLGAAIAMRRGQHLRLTFAVARLPKIWQERLGTFSEVVVAVFLAQLLVTAIEYTKDQLVITTDILHIPVAVSAAAVPTGTAFMLGLLLNRLVAHAKFRHVAASMVVIAVLAALFWLGAPALDAIGNYNLIVMFVFLVMACVLLGVPIAFAFGIAASSYLYLLTDVPLTIIVNRVHEGTSDFILLSIPLFIFLGLLMDMTGLSRAMIEFLLLVIGDVKNGLSYVLLGGMYLVSGISGSKAADMAAIVPILVPEMKKRGVSDGEIVSLLAASGAMAETIPPSIILISVGVVTGVSISDLFVGGLVPAAVGALALVATIYLRSRGGRAAPRGPSATRAQLVRATIVGAPALILPFLIRAAVINGIATATEVATIGIIYTVLCGIFIYRQFPWRRLYSSLVAAASLSGCIILIIGLATAMAWALTQSGFSSDLADLMMKMPGGKAGFLIVSIILFAVLGSVLEGFPAIVLFAPLLFPIARNLGIHEVQYTMVVVLSMSLGLFSPPLGVGYYSTCAIAQVSPDKAVRDIWIYMGALLAAVIVVAAVPWLSIGFL